MQIIEMYLCVTLPCPLLAENTTTAEKKELQYVVRPLHHILNWTATI